MNLFTKIMAKKAKKDIDDVAVQIHTVVNSLEGKSDEEIERYIIAFGESVINHAALLVPVYTSLVELYSILIDPVIGIVKSCIDMVQISSRSMTRYEKSFQVAIEAIMANVVDIVDDPVEHADNIDD